MTADEDQFPPISGQGVTIKTSRVGLGNLFPIKNESLRVFVKCRAAPPGDFPRLNTPPDWTTIT